MIRQERYRARGGAVPTIGDLLCQRMGNWCWFNCTNPACGHYRAAALVPIAIKVGLGTPFDWVQARARCEACGHLGAHTTSPSWGGTDTGWVPFPVSGAANSR